MEPSSDTSTSISSNNDNLDLEQPLYLIKLGDENYDDSLKLAESYKEEGNRFFLQEKYTDAIDKFTDAINLNIETKKNAIYYSNRANCHNRVENFGLGIQDADKAIEIDKDYIKPYFRRASANLILANYDKAIEDLQYINLKVPNDTMCLEKMRQAKIERKKKLFSEMIASDRSSGGER